MYVYTHKIYKHTLIIYNNMHTTEKVPVFAEGLSVKFKSGM